MNVDHSWNGFPYGFSTFFFAGLPKVACPWGSSVEGAEAKTQGPRDRNVNDSHKG